MIEGFLEMQSLVSRVQSQLEIRGDEEYRRLEFGTERLLHTPELDRRIYKEEPTHLFLFRRFWN